MVGGIIVLIITGIAAFALAGFLKRKFPLIDAAFLKKLFFYHVLVSLAYYLYVLFNPSDSKAYYNSAFLTDDWLSLYGTSTTFIKFAAYPFIRYLFFSYEATMALFAFFGYLGFVFFYLLFKERIKFRHTFLGVDLLILIFLLPNLHFWSGSLGKGSAIFLGFGLYFFGISKPNSRWLAVLIGGWLVYHVRPHIMLVVLVSTVLGFVFSTRGLSNAVKFVFLAGGVIAFFFIYQDVLLMVGVGEDELLTEGFDLSHRARELSKATSGVDISGYSLPMQLFTFIYRPLFFDAPGMLGMTVSVENVFYLLITLKLFNWNAIRFLFQSSFLTKTALTSFICVSIALAQIAGNLGLAIRQKSQVMILFMFVILAFLDQQKYLTWRRQNTERIRRQRLKEVLEANQEMAAKKSSLQ